ncbi:hypothetical protein NPIL_80391 [Nephila pilipes]|uniref:Uncharacterized protein n=1 Tax=Nephila pilipes TaxID=299642 RepID=A0A8X6I7W2_NEPPI|nr:hypothetical protein NPIL_80391 [Nephila pilipes]
MASLEKGRKMDFRYIAERLGERVTDDLQIIHFKNLILNISNYEEEFVREMLNTRIEERIETSTSRVSENYDTIERHNSNTFEIRKLLPKFSARKMA